MEFWRGLWQIVFVSGVALFTAMAIWVTVGGIGEIKQLFRRIDASHKEGEEKKD